MPVSEYEYRFPGELRPRQRDFRTHSPDQINRLSASIAAYGFNQPVAIDADNRIVCGAGLVAAAKKLGLNRIPVVVLDHLTEAQQRAYAVAANKLTDMAGYDELELSLELSDLRSLFDTQELPELGIATPELDRLFALGDGADGAGEDTIPERTGTPLVKPGQRWDFGQHRLVAGSALEAASYDLLLGDERAQFCLSDVPYNLTTDTFSTTGRHADFQQGAGEFTGPEFVRFLSTAMRHMAAWSSDGSIHMFFMSWHFLLELLRAGNIVYDDLKTIITWVKPHPGLGSWYRSQSEFIAAFKKGKAPHINNLGNNGRNRGTVWEYDSLAQFSADRDEQLAAHPTCKPVSLLADAIRDNSHRGGIILDPFAGSGSLAIAAEQTGRVARLIELDPHYAEVALMRFEKQTGIEARLFPTMETLSDLAAREPNDAR